MQVLQLDSHKKKKKEPYCFGVGLILFSRAAVLFGFLVQLDLLGFSQGKADIVIRGNTTGDRVPLAIL